jgi:hypothetical protein
MTSIPPDIRQKLIDNQREIERTIELNQAAVRDARLTAQRCRRTLITAGAEIRSAIADLEKAGYRRRR